MAKTITVAKLIEKLQTILDEEGNLKVLFHTGEFEDEYGTVHPDPSYEGDMTVDAEQQLLIISPFKRINSTDELLIDDRMHTKENGRHTYRSMDDELDEDEDVRSEDEEEDDEYLAGFIDKDADNWEYEDDE